MVQKQKYKSMKQDRKPRNKYRHLFSPTYDKAANNIQWGTDSFENKCCWEHWTAICKISKLKHTLISTLK